MSGPTWPGAESVRQLPFRRLFSRLARPVPEDAEIVTAYTDGQVTRRSNRSKVGYHQAADLSAYQGVEPGDFVVHGLDIMRGSVGVSDARGAISAVCSVCKPSDLVDPRYVAYVMRLQAASGYPKALARGVREGGADFRRWDTLAELPVPVPPIQEQRAAADFLDRETAEIDLFVRDQDELIGLLQERRSAVITHAVTKGLDPNVTLKDSGVMSIGSIPSDWSVAEVRHVFEVLDCKHVTAEFVPDGEFPVASIREVGGRYVSLDRARRTSERYFRTLTEGGRQPRPFDLILSRNASVGQSSLVPDGLGDFALGQDVSLIRDGLQLNRTTFLQYLVQSAVGTDAFATAAIGSTFKRINVDDIKSIRFALPPIDQLHAIVQFLDTETAGIDAAVADVREAIGLVRERRSALISAAVTGEINVRERVREA